ncbi:unnamed protein product [Mytilus coruscus]|uniref:Jacalin-type lectin domain-containing protein n=1 Tax=Mytilus coruscus TaxID=42192 RepID=A0A6J8EFM8_MYTCO|nr:unnamed protein product [Mytilus coruscus]
MVQRVTTENVIPLIKLSNRFNLSILLDGICMFASRNYDELSDMKTFLKLSLNEFTSVIDNYNFTAMKYGIPFHDPESSIFQLVWKYLNHNILEMREQFDDSDVNTLLKTIRIHDILNLDDLKELVERNTVLKFPHINNLLMTEQNSGSNIKKSHLKYRKYSNNFKIFIKGTSFCNNCVAGVIREEKSSRGFDSTDINDRPTKVKLHFIGYGTNHLSTLVRISIEYKSGSMISHEPERYKSDVEHEFDLEDDEVITKVFVKYHGTFIFAFKFKTNFGRELGPFGDYDNMYMHITWKSESCCTTGYLHSCVSIYGRSSFTDYINALTFSWVTFFTEEYCRTYLEGFDSDDDLYS